MSCGAHWPQIIVLQVKQAAVKQLVILKCHHPAKLIVTTENIWYNILKKKSL